MHKFRWNLQGLKFMSTWNTMYIVTFGINACDVRGVFGKKWLPTKQKKGSSFHYWLKYLVFQYHIPSNVIYELFTQLAEEVHSLLLLFGYVPTALSQKVLEIFATFCFYVIFITSVLNQCHKINNKWINV